MVSVRLNESGSHFLLLSYIVLSVIPSNMLRTVFFIFPKLAAFGGLIFIVCKEAKRWYGFLSFSIIFSELSFLLLPLMHDEIHLAGTAFLFLFFKLHLI